MEELAAIVCVIFSQIIPGLTAGPVELGFGVAIVVLLNSVVSLWRVRHGSRWASTAAQFAAMATVNAGIVVVLRILPTANDRDPAPTLDTLYLLLLITLIVTLYDRYRVIGNLSKDDSPGTRHPVVA